MSFNDSPHSHVFHRAMRQQANATNKTAMTAYQAEKVKTKAVEMKARGKNVKLNSDSAKRQTGGALKKRRRGKAKGSAKRKTGSAEKKTSGDSKRHSAMPNKRKVAMKKRAKVRGCPDVTEYYETHGYNETHIDTYSHR